MMRWPCAILVLVLVLACGGAGAVESGQTVRLASDAWPPFTDVDGKPRVAIDLVRDALRRAGFESSSEIRTGFGDIVDSLRSGELDGSAAMWRIPEREKFLLYSRPYLENRLVLVGRTGADVNARTLGELTGRRVAIVAGYGYGEEITGAGGPRFVEGKSDGENVHALLRGEVDYVIADELLIHHLFLRDEEKAKRLLAVGTRPLAVRSLHFALRRDFPDAERIVAAFDAEILKMIGDGTYNDTLQLPWIQAEASDEGEVALVLGGKAAGTEPPSGGYQVFTIPDGAREILDRARVTYIVAGQKYESWDQVPVEYKIPSKQALEPGMETGRPGIVLFEF